MLAERTIYMRVLAPLLLAALTLVIVSVGGFQALSSARAYVGGESLWSKARNLTLAQLRARVTGTSGAAGCAPMSEWLAVPLGDRDARLELNKDNPDVAVVRAGFLRGGNAPGDIDGMIRLYRNFGGTPLLREPIDAWRRGDALIDEILVLGEQICAQAPGAGDADSRSAVLRELDRIDAGLLVVEGLYSTSLGRASRQTEQLLTGAIVLLAVLLVGGGTWFVMRSLRSQMLQRQALVEANTRWGLAAEAAGVGVFAWHPSEQRLELDRRARVICGLDPDGPASMAARDIPTRVHPDDRGAGTAFARSAVSGEPLHARYRVTLRSGETRHLEAVGMVPDLSLPFEQRQLLGVLRDVTDEVLATRLQLDKDAAERVARARTEFMSRLSHELRTPLNAVLGMAQVLEVDGDEPLGPQQRQRVEVILQSGWHLLRLVDDVLDITSIDAGVVAIKPVATDLRAVLRAGLALVEPERAAFDVQIVDHWPAEPARVMADPQRLQQVLVNLLSNACKYNRRGGKITLGYRDSLDEVSVTVTDQGQGITPTGLGELFQPFKRLPTTSDVPGTGLGLVVVKLLTEQMGGRIEVNSEPGQGACFMVWLPKA